MFYRWLGKAGLRRIRFYDLPHSYASPLIQNGESLAYVRDQFGHASIQLTVDTYGHLVPGANRQAVDAWTMRWRRPSATQPQPKTRRALRPEPQRPVVTGCGAHNHASAR